jgi:hypothetical protein
VDLAIQWSELAAEREQFLQAKAGAESRCH